MTLRNVPPHLRIRILYSNDDIVVINKPCDLRSVPGHAKPPPSEKKRLLSGAAGVKTADGGDDSSSKSNRRNAQEAWVKAIELMCEGDVQIGEHHGNENSANEIAVHELLNNLGTTANPCCVPRKLETFVKYCHRNSHRLLPKFQGRVNEPDQKKQKCDKSSQQNNIPSPLRSIAQASYAKIKQKQQSLMDLPTPTKDSESAIGQLQLLGFGNYNPCVSTTTRERLHVVHRLDCQTSGIMVVARNQAAASFLCQAWKERESSIQKVYLAHVRHWPPYHNDRQKEGMIDIPLAPSLERIKWQVLPVSEGGKECKTFWKVYEDYDKSSSNEQEAPAQNSQATEKGITLELHPITGRTHQLRLHCSSIGSGIVGDSLYGDSPISWLGDNPTANQNRELDAKSIIGHDVSTLRLHAHKLTIPNLNNGDKLRFESAKGW